MNRIAQTSASTREWNLLLAALSVCLRQCNGAGVLRIPQEPVDWNSLLPLADRHGVSSLLNRVLAPHKDMVPGVVLNSLHRSHEQNVHQSLFLARELIRILDCLDARGIEAIAYKGIVLSEICYGDLAMRQCGDIDLFVHAVDVAGIREAVWDLGFTPRTRIPRNAEVAYLASGYECTFDSAAGKNLLELQWALQPRFYAVDFDMEGLFKRCVNVTVVGRNMKTPSVEDLLIVLSLHVAKHAWEKLIWLCDIAQIMKRETVNWDKVQSQARELGIERILRVTLLLIDRFFACELPLSMRNAIAADRSAHIFAEQIASSISRGVSYEPETLPYFRLMMRLRERPIDRARFLWRLTFTPGPGEWDVVHLPKPLFPLYRVVRLARLASRLAQR